MQCAFAERPDNFHHADSLARLPCGGRPRVGPAAAVPVVHVARRRTAARAHLPGPGLAELLDLETPPSN
jgi:hypothetical protein